MAAMQRFMVACFAGRLEEVRGFVVEHGVLVGRWMTDVVFRAAAMYGHLHILQWAVAEGGVTPKDKYLQDNLHMCRHAHVMEWLMEHGVRMPRDVQHTCLVSACSRADGLEVVQWLCLHGADPHGTPFEHAVTGCKWHIAQWLVQREPEYPWPRHLLVQVMDRCWSPARYAWVRSVVHHSLRKTG